MTWLSRIAPELPVSNLKQAIDYYEQKLGFRQAMLMPAADYAIVERDDVAIHLFDDEAHSASSMGIHIFSEDLDVLYAELKGRGARVLQAIEKKPWGNRDFRVSDGFGNVIKFTESLASQN